MWKIKTNYERNLHERNKIAATIAITINTQTRPHYLRPSLSLPLSLTSFNRISSNWEEYFWTLIEQSLSMRLTIPGGERERNRERNKEKRVEQNKLGLERENGGKGKGRREEERNREKTRRKLERKD